MLWFYTYLPSLDHRLLVQLRYLTPGELNSSNTVFRLHTYAYAYVYHENIIS